MTSPREVGEPMEIDGRLARLMTDGVTNWAEYRKGDRWIRGPREVREDIGPTSVDGALVRLVTDETVCWVEQWDGERWIYGGATVRKVCMGPWASPEIKRKLGFPAP